MCERERGERETDRQACVAGRHSRQPGRHRGRQTDRQAETEIETDRQAQ